MPKKVRLRDLSDENALRVFNAILDIKKMKRAKQTSEMERAIALRNMQMRGRESEEASAREQAEQLLEQKRRGLAERGRERMGAIEELRGIRKGGFRRVVPKRKAKIEDQAKEEEMTILRTPFAPKGMEVWTERRAIPELRRAEREIVAGGEAKPTMPEWGPTKSLTSTQQRQQDFILDVQTAIDAIKQGADPGKVWARVRREHPLKSDTIDSLEFAEY